MKILQKPEKITGLLYLLFVALTLPLWYILLFVAQPNQSPLLESASETLNTLLFTKNVAQTTMWWHTVALVLSAILAGIYFFGFVRTRLIAQVLLGISLIVSGTAFYFASWPLILISAYISYWSYKVYRSNFLVKTKSQTP